MNASRPVKEETTCKKWPKCTKSYFPFAKLTSDVSHTHTHIYITHGSFGSLCTWNGHFMVSREQVQQCEPLWKTCTSHTHRTNIERTQIYIRSFSPSNVYSFIAQLLKCSLCCILFHSPKYSHICEFTVFNWTNTNCSIDG